MFAGSDGLGTSAAPGTIYSSMYKHKKFLSVTY